MFSELGAGNVSFSMTGEKEWVLVVIMYCMDISLVLLTLWSKQPYFVKIIMYNRKHLIQLFYSYVLDAK